MGRRTFLGTLTGGLLAAPLAAEAQQAGKPALIGVLCAVFCRAFSQGERIPEGRAFKEALQALGYVDGQNILLDQGGAGVPSDQLIRYANRLVRRNASVMLAVGLAATRVARTATQRIPIVMVDVPEAVEFGVVDTLARPGGNITGVTTPLAGLATKQLQLLMEAVPGLARVAVLSNPVNPEHEPARKALQAAAVKGLELHFVEARSQSHEELERVFTAVAKARAGAMLVLRDEVLFGGEVTPVRSAETDSDNLHLNRVHAGWRPHVVRARRVRDTS
jgi:putative ABC transport system substrate-binding protein